MRLQISDKDEASEKLNKTTNKIFVNEKCFPTTTTTKMSQNSENGKKKNHFLSKQNCLCNKINFWGVKKITRNI